MWTCRRRGSSAVRVTKTSRSNLRRRTRRTRARPNARNRRRRPSPSRHAVPRRSFITLLLYLNEGYVGGHTTIWNAVGGQFGPWSDRPGRPRTDHGVSVPPRIGMALVHDHILLHESPELRVGVKHVIRTDVMYERVR